MYEKTTLTTGVTVITEEVPHLLSVAVGVWISRGSRDEDEKNNGISHFIEHMLFKGTEKRSAQDIAREIDSVGGILNAFTSREYTCLYTKVLARHLPLGIDLLSDIYLHPVFSMDELIRERMVILQEINMVEDTPDDLVHDLFVRNLWDSHPLGYPVLGTASNISSVTQRGIKEYYDEYYLKAPILITAAGNLKHSEFVNMVEDAFARDGFESHKRSLTPPEPRATIYIGDRELEQVHICLGLPSLPQNHPDRYRAYLLNVLLGGGMSSRLFQEIREKRGLAYSVYSYLNSYVDAGALTIYAGTGCDTYAEVISIAIKELQRLAEEKVTEDELQRAKDQLKGNILLGLEGSDSRMMKLAKDEIYHGRYISPEEIMSNIDAVTPEQIQGFATDMVKLDNFTFAMLGKVDPARFKGIIPDRYLEGLLA